MSTYKYIHLTNGDHIFAEILISKEKTGFFKLKRPLKLSMKEDENHVHFGFMPWIPFSDDEELEDVIEFEDTNIPDVLIN